MASKDDMTLPLQPNFAYHIYNRGNNRAPIFFIEDNYRFFLQMFREKLSGYVDTFGYCLMSNHFHFLIRIKSAEDVLKQAMKESMNYHKNKNAGNLKFSHYGSDFLYEDSLEGKDPEVFSKRSRESRDMTYLLNMSYLLKKENFPPHPAINTLCSSILSEKFRGFFLGYCKAVNKQQGRTGSLLQRPFRRKCITCPADLKYVLSYIHHNPIHHGLTQHYEDYLWSSYVPLVFERNSWVSCTEVMALFGSMKNFLSYGASFKSLKSEQLKDLFDIPFPEEIPLLAPISL
ncbi:MAG: transposase [Saprospiraceae bacterium]|nr:transposase [Saprospiraceae bacterium]